MDITTQKKIDALKKEMLQRNKIFSATKISTASNSPSGATLSENQTSGSVSSTLTLSEIISVPYLQSMEGNGENGDLTTPQINLVWQDLREVPDNQFPYSLKNGYDNTEYMFYSEMKNSIYAFSVFMLVGNNSILPTIKVPRNGLGDWFWAGDTMTNKITVKLPYDKYVSFWVGMRSKNTISQIKKRIYKY